MLLQFERPTDQSVANQQRRATCCQGYYDKFHGTPITTVIPIPATGTVAAANPLSEAPTFVKVTAQLLNVRTGAGLENDIKTTVKKNQVCEISEVKNGWGKLADGRGWIDMKYTKAST